MTDGQEAPGVLIWFFIWFFTLILGTASLPASSAGTVRLPEPAGSGWAGRLAERHWISLFNGLPEAGRTDRSSSAGVGTFGNEALATDTQLSAALSDPLTWMHVALRLYQRGEKNAAAIAAWRRSADLAPFQPAMLPYSLSVGVQLLPAMDSEDRAVLLAQIRRLYGRPAWHRGLARILVDNEATFLVEEALEGRDARALRRLIDRTGRRGPLLDGPRREERP